MQAFHIDLENMCTYQTPQQHVVRKKCLLFKTFKTFERFVIWPQVNPESNYSFYPIPENDERFRVFDKMCSSNNNFELDRTQWSIPQQFPESFKNEFWYD